MRDLIPDRPPAPIFERVVAARRRRARLRSALAASATALAVVATPALLSWIPRAFDRTTQPAAPQCPGTAPPDFAHFATTPAPTPAPDGTIVVATICRYAGEDEPQGRGAFVRSGVVRGDELAELMTLLNAIDMQVYPVPCPYSFGAKHVVYLRAATGLISRIDVQLSGCRFVTTDTGTYWSTEELRDFLADHLS